MQKYSQNKKKSIIINVKEIIEEIEEIFEDIWRKLNIKLRGLQKF